MEAIDKHIPTLPPNYVSLADLQQRWMKQQQENRRGIEKEKEKEKEKEIKNEKDKEISPPQLSNLPQLGKDDGKRKQEKRREKKKGESHLPPKDKIQTEDFKEKSQFGKPDSSIASSNPNFHNRRSYRRNNRDGKGPKKYRLVESSSEPKRSKNEGAATIVAEIDGGDETVTVQVDTEQTDKVENKIKKKKKFTNKKKQNPVSKEQKAASNGECSQQRENEEKGGVEAPLKPAIGDRTVEIGGGEAPMKPTLGDRTVKLEEEIKKLSINGRGWRNNKKSRAVIEGSKWTYRGNGRSEHRAMVKPRKEDGLVWVKKGEVSKHTMVE